VGASGASVLGIEARRIARPFCLASAHAHPLSRPCYCLLATCDPTSSSQSASTRNKKTADKKKTYEDSDSSLVIAWLFCVTGSAGCALTYDLARINYSPWPSDESSNNTSSHPILPSSLATPFSDTISRHDHLLRHSRCRQLLHPPESQPQTKGRPRVRHLRVRRTTCSQTVPPLWWLCTSPFCLFALWPEH
jgi:hypothetical protein